MNEIVYDIILVSKSRKLGGDWTYDLAAKCSADGSVSSIRGRMEKQKAAELIRLELKNDGVRKYRDNVTISPLKHDNYGEIIVDITDITENSADIQNGRVSDDELAELVALAGVDASQ